ncbi:MAG: helix-turn-helix domain-containing protein [Parcubacteria group bacterium]
MAITDQILLTRDELAKRWAVSPQTIDRLRKSGRLPWINLATSGTKPSVRFSMADVEAVEAERRQS